MIDPAAAYITTTPPEDVGKTPLSGVSDVKFVHSGGEKANKNGQIVNSEPLRYGDRPFAPQMHDESEKEGHCEFCPYKYGNFERDAIQYVVIDPIFRNLIELLGQAGKLRIKKNKRDAWIHEEHLTLQLGRDSVIIYSDEPYDLKWIGEWVREHFQDYYQNIDELITKVVNPRCISRDELSIDLTDSQIIQTTEEQIAHYKNKNGYLRFNSPNDITPGLKIYRKGEVLRIEFICTNGFQSTSVIAIRNELLYCLHKICKHPGSLFDFLHSYYPRDTNSDLKHKMNSIERDLHELKQAVNTQFSQPVKATPKGNTRNSGEHLKKIYRLIENIEEDQAPMESLSMLISKEFAVSEPAGLVFLSGFGSWMGKKFKNRVLFEDVSGELIRSGHFEISSVEQIKSAVQELIRAGLLKDDPNLEISFTTMGTILGKKIRARREGIR